MFLIKYFLLANLYVKLSVIALFVMFAMCISVGFKKIKNIRKINKYISQFEETFWSGISLEDFYDQNHDKLVHPLGLIFKGVFEEWQASSSMTENYIVVEGVRDRMVNIAYTKKKQTLHILEKYLDMLSVFARTAPFIGLFSVIMSLIEVFYKIDLENGMNLPIVAVGIGGSLVCMVFSVLLVIVALFLYWIFNIKVQKTNDKIDNFIVEFLNILLRNFDASLPSDILPQITVNAVGKADMQQNNNLHKSQYNEDDYEDSNYIATDVKKKTDVKPNIGTKTESRSSPFVSPFASKQNAKAAKEAKSVDELDRLDELAAIQEQEKEKQLQVGQPDQQQIDRNKELDKAFEKLGKIVDDADEIDKEEIKRKQLDDDDV